MNHDNNHLINHYINHYINHDIDHFIHHYIDHYISHFMNYDINHYIMVSPGIIERRLTRTKVRLFTVPCCSIILFSSEGMEKKYLIFLLIFFVVL